MTEEEREFATEVEVRVTGVEVITDSKNPELVAKVIFGTNKGDISYKPKVDKEEFRDGLKVKSKVQCAIADLPQIIKDIGKEALSKGVAVVVASYNVWNTEADGEPVTYRYVMGQRMMESWTIQKEEVVK